MTVSDLLKRYDAFCDFTGVEIPILLAPMAGACPPELSVEVSKAGGMGGCGVLLMQPQSIVQWTEQFRNAGGRAFQLNNWIPDPPSARNKAQELAVVEFLKKWDPSTPKEVDLSSIPDFASQCDAMIEANPSVISSIMGLYDESYVQRMKNNRIKWFATVTSVTEAVEAQARGADAVTVQGMEAGGHRGTFDAANAEKAMAGLFSLIPAVADTVNIPIIATGGIADPRGIVAAIVLGASAVQIGTGYLRCPESSIPSSWSDAIGTAVPENTIISSAFSGRPGRSFATKYAVAAASPKAPNPIAYPLQRALTGAMTSEAKTKNDLSRMQAWCGQSGKLAKAIPAFDLTEILWLQTRIMMTEMNA